MADHLIPAPDEGRNEASLRSSAPSEASNATGEAALNFQADLREMAARFSSREGGGLPRELAVDLALEVVLHEIVELAALAIGASGAAVILERDGKWVCRARHGNDAPELGEVLSADSVLIAHCSHRMDLQLGDEAGQDTRAEVEVCRQFGVRSALILPLMREQNPIGFLAVFSSRPAAFHQEEQRTLELFAQYVLSIVAQAAVKGTAGVEASAGETGRGGIERAKSDSRRAGEGNAGFRSGQQNENSLLQSDEEALAHGNRAIEVTTWVMSAAVLVCAALLATVAAERYFGIAGIAPNSRSAAAARTSKPSGMPVGADFEQQRAGSATNASAAVGEMAASESVASRSHAASAPARSAVQERGTAREDSLAPTGSLTVYENGRAIFRVGDSADTRGMIESANSEEIKKRETTFAVKAAAARQTLSERSDDVLYRVVPDYPEEARRQKIEGPVVLDVFADSAGAVREVKLVSGDDLLAGAAIAAVKKWRFQPLSADRASEQLQTRVTLRFKLEDHSAR